jgi:hypothetical protein
LQREGMISAYSSERGVLQVSTNKLMSEIVVYDLLGRQLLNKKLNLLTDNITLQLSSGICVVETIFSDQTKCHSQALVR